MAQKPLNHDVASEQKCDLDENIGRRWPSGWWILPAVISGGLLWAFIAVLMW